MRSWGFSPGGRISPALYPVGDYSAGGGWNAAMDERPSTVSVVTALTRKLLESHETPKERGFMAIQTVAFPNDHQHADDGGVVRHRLSPHDSSGGPQRRNKLRANHNGLHHPRRV